MNTISQRMVHEISKGLLGMTGRDPITGRSNKIVPKPLGPTEVERKAPDGARLYNPEWSLGANHSKNAPFITAFINLAIERDQVSSRLWSMILPTVADLRSPPKK